MSAICVCVKVQVGATLDAAVADAAALAKRLQADVVFVWDGKLVRIRHSDTPDKSAARVRAAVAVVGGHKGAEPGR